MSYALGGAVISKSGPLHGVVMFLFEVKASLCSSGVLSGEETGEDPLSSNSHDLIPVLSLAGSWFLLPSNLITECAD